jgi:hypothetical protein
VKFLSLVAQVKTHGAFSNFKLLMSKFSLVTYFEDPAEYPGDEFSYFTCAHITMLGGQRPLARRHFRPTPLSPEFSQLRKLPLHSSFLTSGRWPRGTIIKFSWHRTLFLVTANARFIKAMMPSATR